MGELYHHGIKGQKHGVNRYQSADGTWTEEGLRRRRLREGNDSGGLSSAVSKIKAGIDAHKKKSKKMQALKKARKAREEKKKQAEKLKKKRAETLKKARKTREEIDKVIATGDMDKINKYKSKLTPAQRKQVIERLSFEQKLSEIKAADEKRKFESAQNVIKTVGSVATGLQNVVTATYTVKDLVDKHKEGKDTKTQKLAKKAFTDLLSKGDKASDNDWAKAIARTSQIYTLEQYTKGKNKDGITTIDKASVSRKTPTDKSNQNQKDARKKLKDAKKKK